jgi:polynucleotide 5'-kinase involved in rRNA processing
MDAVSLLRACHQNHRAFLASFISPVSLHVGIGRLRVPVPSLYQFGHALIFVQISKTVRRTASHRYISDETPMDAYLNASHIINNQRKVAREVRPGPVVVVVGPPCSGKTSLVKILANYAIRAGWNPLLVDTSVEQNLISVPGALAAVQV